MRTVAPMAFGNPYGDPYDAGTVADFVARLAAMDVRVDPASP